MHFPALSFKGINHDAALQVQHKSVNECAAEKPEACEGFRYALYQCRRASVDPRSRIQGNKGY
jgi:cytochrome c oxidase assembly factor 5